MDFVDKCKSRVWLQDVAPDEQLGKSPTMLANNELMMLHWLARNMDLHGSIVDAGAFLGGSTGALASGLSRRSKSVTVNTKIHVYDMFIAPNDPYSLGEIGHGKKAGDTVLDLFAKFIEQYCSYILVYAGDFARIAPPRETIDILFVDIAKTRALNKKIVMEYFEKMVPGHSILIQQDYNDQSCPWVNATMERLKGNFEYVCDESASRVYLYLKPIENWHFLEDLESLVREEQLLRQAIISENSEVARYFTAVGLAWTLFEKDGFDAANYYLDNLEYKQPWQSNPPYTDLIKNDMSLVKNKSGLDEHNKSYFDPA